MRPRAIAIAVERDRHRGGGPDFRPQSLGPVLLLLLAALLAAVGAAHAAPPSATPDRIVLGWTGDPATSQAVTWRTDPSVRQAVAQVALADAAPDPAAVARTVAVTSQRVSGPDALYHTAVFDHLLPDTLYTYRVGDGERWSEWFQFRTASREARPFSFLFFGDAQEQVRSLWSRTLREAFRKAPDARFMLHSGDLINTRGGTDAEWGEFFDAGGWLHAMVPNLAVPGNHEYGIRLLPPGRTLARLWRPQFAFPENGVEGLEESNYYVDYQGLRVVALNSNKKIEEQAAWLEGVLADNPMPWTIAVFHHPMLSTKQGRDNAEIRRRWQPILERYGVDLVLQGHDHTYARGHAGDGPEGPVYVVSVSGPKMYRLDREAWMERATENQQLFQVVRVSPQRLTLETYTTTGRLFDAFDLEQRAGATPLFVDRAPAEPASGPALARGE